MRRYLNRYLLMAVVIAIGPSVALAQASPTAAIGSAIPVLRPDSAWSIMDWVRWTIVLLLLVLAAFAAWRIRRTGPRPLTYLLQKDGGDVKVIQRRRIDEKLTVYLIEHDGRQFLIAAGHTGLIQLDPNMMTALTSQTQAQAGSLS